MTDSSKSITMWENQRLFYNHMTKTFCAILNELKCRLDHRFYLVGFPTQELPNRPNPCCYPEGAEVLNDDVSEAFENIKTYYKPPEYVNNSSIRLQGTIPIPSHAHFCEKYNNELRDNVKLHVDAAAEVVFCSAAYQVQSHVICVVLIISRSDHDAYPHLEAFEPFGSHGLIPSFLFAVIGTFLKQVAPEILKPDARSFSEFMSRDHREFIRIAGAVFTKTMAFQRGFKDVEAIQKNFSQDWFSTCNFISSLTYESKSVDGHLVLSQRKHPDVRVDFELATPVSVDDHRKVRKLLEMCGKSSWLLASDLAIYGLGRVDLTSYKLEREDLFIVEFYKHYSWRIIHGEKILMEAAYNEPKLPASKIDKSLLDLKLRDAVPRISDESKAYIVNLVEGVTRTGHGTMVVVSSDAETEAKRLETLSFLVKPFRISDEQLKPLSSIDGAILLDIEGQCRALGVILDGEDQGKGKADRGARFNSAIRYTHKHTHCVAVVVSEDGMVNIVVKGAVVEP